MPMTNQREIKFRAWFDEGRPGTQMREVLELKWTKHPRALLRGGGLAQIEDLMQYTGLKDKNGVEIYEGDVVRHPVGVGEVKFGWFDSSHEAGYSRYHYHQGFYIAEGQEVARDSVDEDVDWQKVEIIGNIYENPELLGVQHD